MVAATVEVVHYARRDRRVFSLISVKGGFGLAAGVLALIPVFGVDVFHDGDIGVGVLMAARGVGALVGPFFGHRLSGPEHRRLFRVIGLALGVFGLSYMALGLAPAVWVAAIVIFVAHLGGGTQWALSTYGLQVLVPDYIRGRVFAVDFALITLSLGISSLVASAIADSRGPTGRRLRPGWLRGRVGGRVVDLHTERAARHLAGRRRLRRLPDGRIRATRARSRRPRRSLTSSRGGSPAECRRRETPRPCRASRPPPTPSRTTSSGCCRRTPKRSASRCDRRPPVTRRELEVNPDQFVSTLVWGNDDPELVFLHGGGQNAHTWDTVVLALGRPALAIDLPGHGRSDRRADRNYGPWRNADAVAIVMEQLAPNAKGVVGMSLGGATTTRLAAVRPDLTRRAVIVDVTPQVNDPGRAMTPEQRGSVALIGGPPTYESFEAVAAATIATSPKRTEAGVRRGVRHNTVRLEDGRWAWRYDLFGERTGSESNWGDFTSLWDDVVRDHGAHDAGAGRRLRLRAAGGPCRVRASPAVGAMGGRARRRARGAERPTARARRTDPGVRARRVKPPTRGDRP